MEKNWLTYNASRKGMWSDWWWLWWYSGGDANDYVIKICVCDMKPYFFLLQPMKDDFLYDGEEMFLKRVGLYH